MNPLCRGFRRNRFRNRLRNCNYGRFLRDVMLFLKKAAAYPVYLFIGDRRRLVVLGNGNVFFARYFDNSAFRYYRNALLRNELAKIVNLAKLVRLSPDILFRCGKLLRLIRALLGKHCLGFSLRFENGRLRSVRFRRMFFTKSVLREPLRDNFRVFLRLRPVLARYPALNGQFLDKALQFGFVKRIIAYPNLEALSRNRQLVREKILKAAYYLHTFYFGIGYLARSAAAEKHRHFVTEKRYPARAVLFGRGIDKAKRSAAAHKSAHPRGNVIRADLTALRFNIFPSHSSPLSESNFCLISHSFCDRST